SIAEIGDLEPLASAEGRLMRDDARQRVPRRLPGMDGWQRARRHCTRKVVDEEVVAALVAAREPSELLREPRGIVHGREPGDERVPQSGIHARQRRVIGRHGRLRLQLVADVLVPFLVLPDGGVYELFETPLRAEVAEPRLAEV